MLEDARLASMEGRDEFELAEERAEWDFVIMFLMPSTLRSGMGSLALRRWSPELLPEVAIDSVWSPPVN